MKKPLQLICKIALAILIAAPLTRGQSLWQEGAARNLVADKRATQVGDILSILIQESNTANRQNNTKTSKTSDIDASLQAFFYSPAASSLLTKKGQLPALKTSAAQSFEAVDRSITLKKSRRASPFESSMCCLTGIW